MFKNKIAAVTTAGMLAMSLGLAACGGANSAASTAESASAEATSAVETASATEATSAATEATSADAAATDVANLPVYWEGTLADGSNVAFVDDYENSEVMVTISKADGSDAKIWSGALTVDADNADKVTLTDKSSGETLVYTYVAVDQPEGTLTLDLEGYGEVQLKGVTMDEAAAELDAAATQIQSDLASDATSAAE